MKRRIVFILCIGLLMVSLFGCVDNGEQEIHEAFVQKTEVTTLEPSQQPNPEPVKQPSLKEIATHSQLNEEQLVLIEDKQLWQKMHVQLVKQNYVLFAVIGDLEKTVVANPGWGSQVFEYKILDIDQDGQYEMVGFFDWGSGITRSIPFVLKVDGEYYAGGESDKIELKFSSGEEAFVILRNMQIAEDGKSLFADARPALSGEDYSQVEIYYEDGKYIFEVK